MKYIRTKDGRIELNDETIEREIIAEADTIEELCDEFVCDEMFVYDKEEIKFLISEGEIVYGAIWTDKGLIYVAKMNESGVLELL